MQTVSASNRDSLEKLLWQPIEDTVRIMALIDLANLHRTSEPGKADVLLKQAYDLSVEEDYPRGTVRSLNAMGVKLVLEGDKEDAIRHFLLALQLAEEHRFSQLRMPILGNIGVLYDELLDGENALKYQRMSLEAARKSHNRQYEAAALNNLGSIWNKRLHNTDSSLAYFYQAYALKQALGDSMGLGTTLNNLAEVHLQLGRQDSALAYLRRGLALNQRTGNLSREISTRLLLSKLFLQQQAYAEAGPHLTFALEQSLKAGFLDLALETSPLLVRYYEATGQKDQAIHCLKAHVALQDSLTHENLRKKAHGLERDLRIQERIRNLNDNTRKQEQILLIMAIVLSLTGAMSLVLVRLIRSRNRAILRLNQVRSELQTLNQELEHRVKERTAALEARNAQLQAYAHHNSHRLRAPLATLMGLIHVLKLYPITPEMKKYLAAMDTSAALLDEVVHDINDTLNDDPHDPSDTGTPTAD